VSYKGNLLLIKLKRSSGGDERADDDNIVEERVEQVGKKRGLDDSAVKIKFPLNGNKTVTGLGGGGGGDRVPRKSSMS